MLLFRTTDKKVNSSNVNRDLISNHFLFTEYGSSNCQDQLQLYPGLCVTLYFIFPRRPLVVNN